MSFNPFPTGTQLNVETCFGDRISGEVITYEHCAKMLVLSCVSKDSKGNKCSNQSIINLAFCKSLQILCEAKTPEPLVDPPTRLNLLRINERLQQSLEEREILLYRRSEYATARGREIYALLSKHFASNEICWQADNIVVLQQVIIAPPYRVCDISSKQKESKLVYCVQRVVEKFIAQNVLTKEALAK